MKINLALWDRVLRYIFGILFVTWAIAGGPWWSYLGLYLVASAAWGICLFYLLAGFQTYYEDTE